MNKNGILIKLSESEKTRFGREDFARQSLPQKVFSAIWAVESEVNNGGFSQYFFNSSAESAWFVVEALETVGALETAGICRRAIASAFPSGLPQSKDAIRSAARFPRRSAGKAGTSRPGIFFLSPRPHRLAVCLCIRASTGVWAIA